MNGELYRSSFFNIGCHLSLFPRSENDFVRLDEPIVPEESLKAKLPALINNQCFLTIAPDNRLQYRSGEPLRDQSTWHESCVDNIIPVPEIYREYIDCSDPRRR